MRMKFGSKCRNTSSQSSTANRENNSVNVWILRKYFTSDSPLSCLHQRVIKWINKYRSFFLRKFQSSFFSIIKCSSFNLNTYIFPSEFLRLSLLDIWSSFGHKHIPLIAKKTTCQRNSLSMITGARTDNKRL